MGIYGVTDVNIDPPGMPSNDTALLKLILQQLGWTPGNPNTGQPVEATSGFLQAPVGTTDQVNTRYGTTNNIHTTTFTGGAQNIQYTLEYFGNGAADNDTLKSIHKTVL